MGMILSKIIGMNFWDRFMNMDTNLIIAIATIVLALLTAALAYFTKVMADETRRTREQNVEPHIVVTIEAHKIARNWGCLVIENVGKGVAYDLLIKEKEGAVFRGVANQELSLNDLPWMKLKTLKSGERLEHALSEFSAFPKRLFEFEAESTDVLGKRHKNSNIIDVDSFMGLGSFEEKGMDALVRVMDKFEKSFASICSNRRLGVDAYNQQDRQNEREERNRQREEFRAANKQG
jgi:hypothetical protein